MLACGSTEGASELPTVLLEIRPSIRGLLLLLLGRQAALTAIVVPPPSRHPGFSGGVPGGFPELVVVSRSGARVLSLHLLMDLWGFIGVFIPAAGVSG